MMDSIKQFIDRYWFILSAASLALFYILYDRQGRKLDKALADAQMALLSGKLADINERAQKSDEDFENAKQDYEKLKRIHGDLLYKLGISAGPGKDD